MISKIEDNCVFCKIVRGQIPCYRLYEDERFLAFLDVNPLNLGHALVIPKKHYRWTWDVPDFGSYWETAKVVAKALMRALKAPMVEFLTHGTDLYHAHIWVVPIFKGEEGFINASKRKNFSDHKMKEVAKKITSYIKEK